MSSALTAGNPRRSGRFGAVFERQDARRYLRQPRHERPLGQHNLRLRVVEHQREPRRREGRVERDIRRARLQDREYPGDHLERALDREGDNVAAPDPGGPQMAGDAVHRRRQFAVVPAALAEYDRSGVGTPRPPAPRTVRSARR